MNVDENLSWTKQKLVLFKDTTDFYGVKGNY